MKKQFFADYLNHNPEISEFSNLFSGSQAHKELQILAGNTGRITDKHKHAEKLMHGLNKHGVYDDDVITGRAKFPKMLDKKQIMNRLQANDKHIFGAHSAFKQNHTYTALRNMVVQTLKQPRRTNIMKMMSEKSKGLSHNSKNSFSSSINEQPIGKKHIQSTAPSKSNQRKLALKHRQGLQR